MNRDSVWVMTNVVCYDGRRAYVNKFIIQAEAKLINGDSTFQPTTESEERLEHTITGNGDILKIDILYGVSFDDIVALKDSDNSELINAYERFKYMWFGD